LETLHNDYLARGFEVLEIDGWDALSTLKSYARKNLRPFLWDPNNRVWTLYRQNGYVPLNYVIDPSGIVRYRAEGFDEKAVRNAIFAWLPVGVKAGGKEKPAGEVASLSQNKQNLEGGGASFTRRLVVAK
jgi:hypothetical protein